MKNPFTSKKTVGAVAIAVFAAASLSACGGASAGGNSASGDVSYWLWDANQLPAYQQCADDFHKANPDITVKITQTGWDDYWGKLTNGMAAGTAPDVFTDHLSKFPDFVKTKQLVPLDDAVKAANINLNQYNAGLADLWVGQDGKRYGLPKDWDTISLFYNKKMAAAAGLSPAQMASLTWNPQDGGTYEKAIAHLTVDKNGKRGDEPGFDKNNVAVYGLGLPGSDGENAGQTQWSFLSATTGWTTTDKNPWGTHFNYDDKRLQDTIAWWASLAQKGYMPKLETTVGASAPDAFGAGKAAINSNGDWMIGQYKTYKGVDLGIAPTPVGPNGKSMSMFNGLADSIWAGTKKKDASIKWVEYLASTKCQDVVASKAVVFPAIKTSSDKAAAAFKAKGIDVTPFTQHVKDDTTFLLPITDNAAKVAGIMKPAMDAVVAGKAPASSLTAANGQVNALFAK
ncbi:MULTISPECIES: sugar ABC transporter substrate-binding protein [unclassified Arthrobacter]|uniref:ABC transporter substrate-binding protein n=1 Tax=unclassified Arthrobacter TaxID=235627 RepID=UPI00159D172D|nr:MULTISPECIES: sugar ABC transporter substrate-binding protein [unclassified Arthrobacter]MCQ9165704.1 sugar ABC transporter substrate-binding protein [Arthrobacter sp. STN4]NVN00555.1 sugar ABC transporter substrate-binding protein [Arthrobacter sp. SDTb3-6]